MKEPARILIVDHSLDTLSSLYINLLKENYNVEVSNDPAEILPRVQRFHPQVVVMNKNLNGVDFDSVCSQLVTKKLPVVVLLDEPSQEEIVIEGCAIKQVIVKPIQVDKLVRYIEQFTSEDA